MCVFVGPGTQLTLPRKHCRKQSTTVVYLEPEQFFGLNFSEYPFAPRHLLQIAGRIRRRYDMRSQMQGGKNWILPKDINANRFFCDSHCQEIWKNHFSLYGTEWRQRGYGLGRSSAKFSAAHGTEGQTRIGRSSYWKLNGSNNCIGISFGLLGNVILSSYQLSGKLAKKSREYISEFQNKC